MSALAGIKEFGFFSPGMEINIVSKNTRWNPAGQETMSLSVDGDYNSMTGKHGGQTFISPPMKFGSGTGQLSGLMKRKSTHNYDYNPDLDNPNNDLVGDFRAWNNWCVKSFTPTGTMSGSAQKAVSGSVQVTQNTCSFKTESQAFYDLVSQVESSGQRFIDQRFPPENSSLVGFGEDGNADRMGRYRWAATNEIFPGGYDIAGHAVSPSDVCQGELGDCYFVCAISSVAEVPDRIRRLFLSKRPNRVGAQCIALFITGIWEEIIVDDILPVKSDNTLGFARSRGNDLWVSLIEKAWAKVHGGYANIPNGTISEALVAMTGCPVAFFPLLQERDEENWRAILEAEQRGFIMSSSSDNFNKTSSDAQDRTVGLSALHAYSIISAHEVYANGQQVRLLKLRNPWGKGEWFGDWSDRSPLWTPELSHQLRGDNLNPDDGIFFMAFSDYRRYFHDFCVAYYHDNYQSSSKKFNSGPGAPTMVSFNINRPGQYYFSVHQINIRMFPKSQNYTYSNVSLKIAKQENGSMNFVANTATSDQVTMVMTDCSPGQYVAYITIDWKRNANEFTFNIYGPDLINLEPVNPEREEVFTEQLLKDRCKRERQHLKDFYEQGQPSIFYRYEENQEMSFFYYMNESTSTTLYAQIQVIESTGVEFMPPYTGQRLIEMVVQPGECKVAVAKMKGQHKNLVVTHKTEFAAAGSNPHQGGQGGEGQIRHTRSQQYGNDGPGGNYGYQQGGYPDQNNYGGGGYGSQGNYGGGGGYGDQSNYGGSGSGGGGYGDQSNYGGGGSYGDQSNYGGGGGGYGGGSEYGGYSSHGGGGNYGNQGGYNQPDQGYVAPGGYQQQYTQYGGDNMQQGGYNGGYNGSYQGY